ncbi:MAG: metallophosphoesterase family protein [Alphaproteobacteria bacterium]|nr:metallophosphoesterase family protein [Alphaproteobacteria bacterium]
MKIGVLSDLHLPAYGMRPHPAQAGDVMVLAGDISVGLGGIAWAETVFTCPVIYVLGNHEYYGQNMDELDSRVQQRVAGTNVTVLRDATTVIDGVRFIGATLWTDFDLYGTPKKSAYLVRSGMNDYRVIGKDGGALMPADTRALHLASRAYLERTLAEPFAGKTVVVTHHAPSPKSIAPRFLFDPLTPGFVSDLESVVASSGAALWIHGHVHDSMDYMLGNTRVIANPKGYVGEASERESPPFRWDYTVEI